MSSSPPPREGPGSVSGAPNLPAGFTDTFTSRYIDTGELRLHAVIGGEGPPLLLVHGWPETWYAWRLLMPALARDFEVIAVDQRGIGLSDKPADGYDTGTLAADLVALMDALGHERFAAGRPRHRVRDQLRAGRGSPGPGRPRGPRRDPRASRRGSLTARVRPRAGQQPALAHPVQPGREAARTAHRGTRGRLLRLRVRHPGRERCPTRSSTTTSRLLSNPDVLPGSLGFYRAFDATLAQNEQRKSRPLTMPVLAIGGAASYGEHVAEAMKLVADDVQSVVIAGAGHWVAEQAPDEMLAALTAFLAPYRDGSAAAQDGRLATA